VVELGLSWIILSANNVVDRPAESGDIAFTVVFSALHDGAHRGLMLLIHLALLKNLLSLLGVFLLVYILLFLSLHQVIYVHGTHSLDVA